VSTNAHKLALLMHGGGAGAFGEGAVILDDFNRPNESPANDNWTWVFGQGDVVDNRLVAVGSTSNLGVWNTPPTKADYDLTATLSIVGPEGGAPTPLAAFLLRAKDTAEIATFDAYQVAFVLDSTGNHHVAFGRLDDGVGTELDTVAIDDLEDGMQIGARIRGDTIAAYENRGEGWAFIGQVEDATYSQSGSFGVRINTNTSLELDDFAVGMLPG